MSDITFVTMFFRLSDKYDERRNVDIYLKNGYRLLDNNINLIIYTEEEFTDNLTLYRKNIGLLHKTKIITMKFSELPLYNYLDNIIKFRQLNPVQLSDPNIEPPEYIMLILSKWLLIEKSIINNYFNSQYYAWIDFGIYHIAIPPIEDLNTFKSDKVKLMTMRSFFDHEFIDLCEYYSCLRRIVAGGFAVANKDIWNKIIPLYYSEVITTLQFRIAPSEEQLYPVLMNKYPEYFERYDGHYEDILNNFHHFRSNLSRLINLALQPCRNKRVFSIGVEIVWRMFNDLPYIVENNIPYDVLLLLDESFIVCYYHDSPCQERCEAIILKYQELIKEEKYKESFETQKIHIRNNFQFINNKSLLKFLDL